MSIKTKILLPAIALTLLVAAAILASNVILFSNFVEDSTADRIRAASKVAAHHLYELKQQAASASLSMDENRTIANALVSGDISLLASYGRLIQEKSGVDFCTFTDAEGSVLFRTHSDISGDSITFLPSVRAALAGENVTSVEEAVAIRLSARSAMPVYNDGGEIVGTVSVGYRLDTDDYVDAIKDISGCEATVFLGDERISTTVLNENGERALGTTANPHVSETVLAGASFSGEVEVLGRATYANYAPLTSYDGQILGMLFVGQYTDETSRTVLTFVEIGLVIALILLAVYTVFSLAIVARIVTPIQAMTKAAAALASGDTELDIHVSTHDEMRTLADAFNSMIENTQMQVRTVESIAAGEISTPITVRSEKDVMNRELESLSRTLREQADAIRREHGRVQLMLDATPLAMRLWDRELNIVECNEAAVKLFGLKNKQEYMDRYLELSPERQPNGRLSADMVKETINEAFEKGEYANEWMYRLTDGTPLPAENRLVRVPYGGGYVVASYSRDLREHKKMMAEIEHRDSLLDVSHRAAFILFNTTDEKDIEAVLAESMELLGGCVRADQIFITQNEVMGGILHFVCKYAWVGGGAGPGGAILPGMSFSYGLDPGWDRRFARGEHMNGPVSGLPEAIQKFFAPFGTKSALIIPVFVQERFWGLVGFCDGKRERVFGADEDRILSSISLFMAVSVNRTLQNAAIGEAHNRTRLLTNATPIGFNLCDRTFQNIETNDTAVKLFGLSSHQEYLERFYDLSPEYQPDGSNSKERALELLDEAFESGYRQFEWLHQKPDGTLIPMEVTLVRVDYEGGYAVAGYMRDLREHKAMMEETQRLQAELESALREAQDANRAKSSFLASMSHEIRTPLNAVVGLSELILAEEGLDGDTADKLDKIHSSGMTILSIVNDILDISKIESGKFEINPIQYDTPSLINDTVTLNVMRIGEKPIIFKLHVDENLPGALYGDDLRVKQVFNNLLSNAFKYTYSGTVEWRVSFERDGGDVWLLSSVRDSGIGIKPEDAQKLFSDYNQVDTRTNRKVEGTGLGLAITKRLVEMMDGGITVDSEYGKGSTFTVRLRQKLASDGVIGADVARNLMDMRYTLSKRAGNIKLARANLSYASVLVVDDIPTNLDVVKGMMKPYGVKVDCADSGPRAIEMIIAENPRYSAVFMDHMMPGMDGVEATRIIRGEIGTDYARSIPIIALTANAIVGNEEMFLSSGFQDFISKPIDIMKLDATLRRWVRDKDIEKELLDSGEGLSLPDGGQGAEGGYSLLEGIIIAGVDIYRALERFGGDKSILIDVLRSYSVNTRPLLDSLRGYLAAGDLENYAIVVHGVKGSSYGIFAQEAGGLAAALEASSKAGDLDAVQAGSAAFEETVEALLDNIGKALAEIDARASKPLLAEPDPGLFKELREACAAFDMDRVDIAMEKLEAFRYMRGEKTVAWLRAHVSNMAFEEIYSGVWPSEGEDASLEFTAPDAEILIADDNETNMKAALGLLRPLLMRADAAANGKEALQMIRDKRYDLVFMDYLMPVMDGVEAVKQLRSMDGEYYKTVPVIALSADTAPNAGELFLEAGMNDFVSKPIDVKVIREKVKRWLPAGLIREAAAGGGGIPQGGQTADLPVIEGIDASEGVRYSGTEELFISLLGDFYKLIDIKAAKIEKCLADGMLRDVTIEVHALKSTSRMIGAKGLSEEFARLEQYGHDGDREALEREAPAVLERLRNLKPALRPYGETAEREKRPASKEELVSLLSELSAAIDGFDLDGADGAMKRLEELALPGECRGQMEALRAYMADVAMEEVMSLTEAMTATIEEAMKDTL